MSKVISLEDARVKEDLIKNSAPNFKSDKETNQWLQGKISRGDVILLIGTVREEFEKLKVDVSNHLAELASQQQQALYLTRMLGLQIETILRIAEGDGTENPKMRAKFKYEFKRTVEFASFLDKLNPSGEFYNKSMKEKLELIKEWNNNSENYFINRDYIGLKNYIETHPDEFTEQEVREYQVLFNFDVAPSAVVADNVTPSEDLNVAQVSSI